MTYKNGMDGIMTCSASLHRLILFIPVQVPGTPQPLRSLASFAQESLPVPRHVTSRQKRRFTTVTIQVQDTLLVHKGKIKKKEASHHCMDMVNRCASGRTTELQTSASRSMPGIMRQHLSPSEPSGAKIQQLCQGGFQIFMLIHSL